MQERDEIVQSLTDEISQNWEDEAIKSQSPKLFLLGGFQGSGKTTLVDNLREELHLTVIHLDQIRSRLFARGLPFSQAFVNIVDRTRNALIKKALNQNRSIIVDTNVTPARIDEIKSLLTEEQTAKYQVITIHLDALREVLIERLGGRVPRLDTYLGTLDELKQSLAEHGQMDKSAYDLVINTTQLTPHEIKTELLRFLNQT